MARRKKHKNAADTSQKHTTTAEPTPTPTPAAATVATVATPVPAPAPAPKFQFKFNFGNSVIPDLQKAAAEASKMKPAESDESAEDNEEAPDDEPRDMSTMINELMQGRTDGLQHSMERLPEKLRRRVGALRRIQTEQIALEKQFEAEVRALEIKYQHLYAPLWDKRVTIVTGAYEPCDDEIENEEDEEEKGPDVDVPAGVPEFWLNALQNCPDVKNIIMEEDEEALGYLTDVRVDHIGDDKGFTLNFTFATNPYFTNKKLTKSYFFADENLETVFDHSEGCGIWWKKGQDLVKRLSGETFFSFFSPPEMPDEGELAAMPDEDQAMLAHLLQVDYVIGEAIKSKVVPRAVLYFTGEALDEGDDDGMPDIMSGDDEDEDGMIMADDDDDDEDDEENEDDDNDDGAGRGGRQRAPARGGARKQTSRAIQEVGSDDDDDDDGGAAPAPAAPLQAERPPECKQQ